MKMTIHYADCVGNQNNCFYPYSLEIDRDTIEEEIAAALSRDYTGSLFRDGYRTIANFIGSNCLMMDCDNSESDLFFDWTTPALVRDAFPNVPFIAHFSRNHMKPKNGKQARPKFHCLFPIDWTSDPAAYAELKRKVQAYYPHFDANAVDAARFFFGTEDAKIVVYDGGITLTEFMSGIEIPQKTEDTQFSDTIPLGSRNTKLYSYATSLLKRYGNTKESREKFISESKKCSPPLGHDELNSIWKSALKFYEQVKSRPDYIPPEQFNADPKYMPEDYSHVGQAEMLAEIYGNNLRYTSSTGFICFDGICWTPSETKPRLYAHELSEMQIEESQKIYCTNDDYSKFAHTMRYSSSISAVLKETAPKLETSPDMLDRNPFYLCTPAGTLDLNFGPESMRPNHSEDLITKVTAFAPGDRGAELWEEFTNQIFCGDMELKSYVQRLCGNAAIGKITDETLIISYGNGKNGKSTFWNAIRAVLGTYADGMAADILTKECKRNIYPELAELQGKRLIIASETAEGARLNEALVKQMCSTDFVRAERKYRDPFSFRPSHTIMLFTNFLPKIGSSDSGTWRRVKLVPFNATISEESDVKNYAEFLVDNAGPAVLKWIVEGAKMVIDDDYRIEEPAVVKEAIEKYRADNNWFHQFVTDCCEVGSDLQESSSRLYQSYRTWSESVGERSHSTSDFYKQLENGEFRRVTKKNQRIIHGIKLKSDLSFSSNDLYDLKI